MLWHIVQHFLTLGTKEAILAAAYSVVAWDCYLRPGEALIRNGAQQRKAGRLLFSWPLLLVQLARVSREKEIGI